MSAQRGNNTMKPYKGDYEILAFREFDTPIDIDPDSYLAMVFCGHSVSGHKTSETQRVRHVAILKVRKWLFKSALVVLVGESAEQLRQEAIDKGIYAQGDPGKHNRDQRVTSDWAPSRSGDTWYWNTATSSSSTTMYWVTNVNTTAA